MNNTDIFHLKFLSKIDWGGTHLKEFLYDPRVTLWHSSPVDTFSEIFDVIKANFGSNSQLMRFLELHLLTEALLQKENTPGWFIPWVSENINIGAYVAPIKWHTCLQGKWQAAPVIFVHERAYLRHFIIGLVSTTDDAPLWPEWAAQLMDESAKRRITSALKACNGIHPLDTTQRFFCYPMTIPNQTIQFTQTSLGLPLALGFSGLVRGETISEEIVATGSVGEDGSVEKITHLSQKARFAREKEFKLLFYPAQNHAPKVSQGIEALPVSNLQEAWMFATLCAPGRTKELLLLSNMLKDARSFVNNCASLPREWLVWARQNGRTDPVMDMLLKSPNLFDSFIEKLGNSLEKGELAHGEALAELMDPESVKELKGSAPLSVFKWFSLNLSMANHRGDVSAAQTWESKAAGMASQASVSDAEAFADFYNHRFIGLYHNRYHFAPKLPDFIKRILDSLEGQYRAQCELVDRAANKALGSLYGSIAQNYGFCGPRYIEGTRRYSALSRKAFGGGREPTFESDCLRQLNYLAYAELDARAWGAAEKTLLEYLGINTWPELLPKLAELSEWHHALLARFFADGEDREERKEYSDWALKNKNRILHRKHPWQLWLNNMGRVARSSGDTRNAMEWYNDSLALCLSGELGPTVQVMALLPLSGIWRCEGLAAVDMASAEKKVRSSAESLNPDHFRILLDEPDFTKTLETICIQLEVLFPFTYR